ncbi:3-oxoacyl-[acyl-carrier protein] reductase [Pseudonocardia thermophila]|uniref:3-oxoacyl-[acyl-carrier protein] reductase n=1 Tax=Pseudonocardia thermophila TaxID=1848 RepID=A0A1M6WQP6_PSETH|nr:SDR family NAD(P)-dependent oxidoreductase [Pseudonocardia thermophila]SHK96063.1 3-oxoacyl-[acyl-carrier protein] reductase [Pseudonocardia thermophila]
MSTPDRPLSATPAPAVPELPRDLGGQVAIVTGGLSGIGAGIAAHLRARGARVVVGDLTGPVDPAETDGVLAVRCDVRTEDDVVSLVELAAAQGGVHVLVNCAGISRKQPITELTLENWSAVIDTNLRGAVLAIKHASRRMIAQRSGSIVNIASIAGIATLDAQNTAYVASKGALMALTRSLVYELAPHGVRINCVAPGLVETPILTGMTQQWKGARVARIPTGRMGEINEIAATVGFLASGASTYVNGQTLVVDGGMTAVSYLSPAARAGEETR